MKTAAQLYAEGFAAGVTPEPELTVDEWADAERIVSREESKHYGQWQTLPFWREPMQKLSATDPTREIAVMKGSQIGGTQHLAICWLGYIIAQAPGPVILVLPSRELVQQTSQTKIDSMIEATPALRARVAPSRSRGSRNTTFNKHFLGGKLMLRGANSASAFRNIDARYLILDDLDGYPGEVGIEGDPVTLAKKRMLTYNNSKTVLLSSPTTRGISRIEREFNAGDQRRYFIPCPWCRRMDFLTWQGFRDHVAKRDGGHHRIEYEDNRPETAHMVCAECGKKVEERWKPQMFDRGEWRPLVPEEGRKPSYHLSGLYSPLGWHPWSDCVAEWLASQGNRLQLKGFMNTILAETWEDRGSGAEAEDLMARSESYSAEVPAGVGILVASVDVQDDRLEVQVKGYGAGEESWLIAFSQLFGSPSGIGSIAEQRYRAPKSKVWYELDQFLKREFVHESGRKMRIECTAVDSSGHHTEAVYRFCKAHEDRYVFAVRGGQAQGEPIVARPTTHNQYRAKLFTLCVDTAKEMIYARTAIATPGPGYMHLPNWVDAEYIAQLSAEKGLWKYVPGRGLVRKWEKVRERNEALDLEVYSLAALRILGDVVIGNLGKRAEQFARPIAKKVPEPDPPPPPRRRTSVRGGIRGGWVSRLKG